MRAVAQLLKEFWLPLVLAAVWAVYNIVDLPRAEWSLKTFVNVFAPTFFIVSWVVAQWFRVNKQQRVENDLHTIEGNLKALVNDLAEKTRDLVGHISGGDSFCYVLSSHFGPQGIGMLTVIHNGKHPLYDVHARVVDLEAFDQYKGILTFENIRRTEIHRSYGNLIPGHAVATNDVWPVGNAAVRRFNIFFTARNGSFTQLLRFRKQGSQWFYATRVDRGGIVFEQVQDGYPRKPDGSVDWDAG